MADESENLKEVLSLLQGIFQDRIIHAAEEVLAETPSLSHIPMPDEVHPALTHSADFVRNFNQNYVRIYRIPPLKAFTMEEELLYPTKVENNTAILTRKKCVGPAPFVGDPRLNEAIYVWNVWVDDWGRYISGSAELVWRY